MITLKVIEPLYDNSLQVFTVQTYV